MKIKNIYYSSHFEKAFNSLPLKVKKYAIKKEKIFREDCFNKSLKTHKLKGSLQNYWAFSINYHYRHARRALIISCFADAKLRILFEFSGENEVGFIDVGTHSIYN